MFWITADPLIAGPLQEFVVTGRVALRMVNPLARGQALGLDGVELTRVVVPWESVDRYRPVRRFWVGVLPLTYLAGQVGGVRDPVIAAPAMRLARFNEPLVALRWRQTTPGSRLTQPTGQWPTPRMVESDRGQHLLYFVDGSTGAVSAVPAEQVPAKHWWPGATSGWRDYSLPKLARLE